MKHKQESIARRNINNLRYADDTKLMAESKEELKRLLMKERREIKRWHKTQIPQYKKKKKVPKKKERLRKCVLPTATQLEHYPRSFMPPHPPIPPPIPVHCGFTLFRRKLAESRGSGAAVHPTFPCPSPASLRAAPTQGFPAPP